MTSAQRQRLFSAIWDATPAELRDEGAVAIGCFDPTEKRVVYRYVGDVAAELVARAVDGNRPAKDFLRKAGLLP